MRTKIFLLCTVAKLLPLSFSQAQCPLTVDLQENNTSCNNWIPLTAGGGGATVICPVNNGLQDCSPPSWAVEYLDIDCDNDGAWDYFYQPGDPPTDCFTCWNDTVWVRFSNCGACSGQSTITLSLSPGGSGCDASLGYIPYSFGTGGCVTCASTGAGTYLSGPVCGTGSTWAFWGEIVAPYTCNVISFTLSNWSGTDDINVYLLDNGGCNGGSVFTLQLDTCVPADSLPYSYTAGLPSDTYMIYIEGSSSQLATFDLCVQVQDGGPPPSYDNCSSPLTLTPGNGIDGGGGTADAITVSNLCATSTCCYDCNGPCTANAGEDCSGLCGGCPPGNICYCENVSTTSPGSCWGNCWGSVENSLWFQFDVTVTDTYFIQVFNQQCANGDGLQFILTSCIDCSNAANTGACIVNDINGQPACSNTQTTNPIYIEAILSPGTYYIVIDGFAGDDCVFDLLVGNNLTVFPLRWQGPTLSTPLQPEQVRIEWALEGISRENSVERFVIERADDMEQILEHQREYGDTRYPFMPVGEVEGVNFVPGKKYFFEDALPEPGLYVYRIRALLADGTEYLSPMVWYYRGDEELSRAIYDSRTGILELRIARSSWDGPVNIQVIEVSGQVLYQTTLERIPPGIHVETIQLSPGTHPYLVRVIPTMSPDREFAGEILTVWWRF